MKGTNATNGTIAPMDLDNEEQARTIPLGTGEFAETISADSTTNSKRSRLRTNAVVLGGVVIAAAGGLFAMRQLGAVSSAQAFDQTVEMTVEKFLERVVGGTDGNAASKWNPREDGQRLVAALQEDYTDLQVPWENVRRDPFLIYSEEPAVPTNVEETPRPVSPRGPSREDLQRERTEELKTLAEGIRIKSVMTGSRPMAIIENGGEDAVVNVGDTLDIKDSPLPFRVKAIVSGSVQLEAFDAELDVRVTVSLFVHQKSGRP